MQDGPGQGNGRYLRALGEAGFLLGVNYWSRAGGPRMWERFDQDRVRAEVRQMRDIGLGACRAFLFNPTFMPQPPAVDAGALAGLRSLAAICAEQRLALLPSLLVGHMSGENYDFPGQAGRSPYTDPEVLAWQQALAAAAAEALARSPAVAAWVLSNEMPLWGGLGSESSVRAWCQTLGAELRRHAPDVPLGTGDGVMGLRGGPTGFRPEGLVDLVDYLGPHTYYGDSDTHRQALYPELAVRALQPLGLPVLLEEFGCSSTQASEEHQAAFFRETVHACLAVGAAGALGWCFSDFELADHAPYRHHAFELGFGITRKDGSEKPVCAELRAISSLLRSLDSASLRFPVPRAAILIPSNFSLDLPFSWEDRERMRRNLVQAYVLCTRAGLEVALIAETADFSPYRLLLAPSTQKLLAPTWERLAAHARAGGTVYWSYFGGDYPFHQGAWCHCFEELSGARHRLRYGCFDLPADRVTVYTGELSLSTSTLPTPGLGGAPFGRAFLPLAPHPETEVLGIDQDARPALLRHRLGQGQVFFFAYPWEHYLGTQAEVNEGEDAYRLYASLARAAGIEARVSATDPRLQVHVVEAGERDLVWAINRSWNEVGGQVKLPGEATLLFPESAAEKGPIGEGGAHRRRTSMHSGSGGRVLAPFAPKEVRVYAVPHAGPE